MGAHAARGLRQQDRARRGHHPVPGGAAALLAAAAQPAPAGAPGGRLAALRGLHDVRDGVPGPLHLHRGHRAPESRDREDARAVRHRPRQVRVLRLLRGGVPRGRHPHGHRHPGVLRLQPRGAWSTPRTCSWPSSRPAPTGGPDLAGARSRADRSTADEPASAVRRRSRCWRSARRAGLLLRPQPDPRRALPRRSTSARRRALPDAAARSSWPPRRSSSTRAPSWCSSSSRSWC